MNGDAAPGLQVKNALWICWREAVQPSFSGTNSSYLLEALCWKRRRLRSVAVVAPDNTPAKLRCLDRVDIVNLRLNLIGQPDHNLTNEFRRRHLAEVVALAWQVEVHAEARRLRQLTL